MMSSGRILKTARNLVAKIAAFCQQLAFDANILSIDGKQKIAIEKNVTVDHADDIGVLSAKELFEKGAKEITEEIRYAGK